MTIIDRFYNAFKTKPAQPSTNQKANSYISQQQLYRTNSDIKRLNEAINAAQQITFSNRLELYRIYQEITEDPHLTSVMQSRKIKAISKNFKLMSTRGKRKENEDARAFFEGSWFQQWLEYAWESIMYGYSLIQLDGIDENGMITGVELVPRQNVKPQLGIYTKLAGDVTGLDYLNAPWLTGVGKVDDLGMLMKVARAALYKKHSLAAYQQYVDLFGMPIRVGKVEAGDLKRAQSMFKVLQDIGTGGFGVMNKDDEIEFIETAKAGAPVHAGLIELLNGEISKAMFGQTMMTENGSSRSQSEVHERLADDYSIFDQRVLAYYVNDTLIPKLIALGLPLQNIKFEWETYTDLDKKFEQAMELLDRGYQIDADFFKTTYEIPVMSDDEIAEKNKKKMELGIETIAPGTTDPNATSDTQDTEDTTTDTQDTQE